MKLFIVLFYIGFILLSSPLIQPKQEDKWYNLLPDCPCKNPDLIQVHLNDGWAKDKGNIQKYHSGSYECFRSYSPVKTPVGKSGQQCCYDKLGELIKSGPGAGTPDKVSSCSGETKEGIMKIKFTGILGHYFKDVKPWLNAGSSTNAWLKYNQTWPPNQGKGCSK